MRRMKGTGSSNEGSEIGLENCPDNAGDNENCDLGQNQSKSIKHYSVCMYVV